MKMNPDKRVYDKYSMPSKRAPWDPVRIPGFNPGADDFFDELTRMRHGTHKPENDMRISKRMTSIEIHRKGIPLEYSVWFLIGGLWYRFMRTGKDPGWEIESSLGKKVQVKFNTCKNGDFYLPPHQDKFVAEFGILGVSAPAGNGIDIMGIISRNEFNAKARRKRFGDGPEYNIVRAVLQTEMHPPQEFLEQHAATKGQRSVVDPDEVYKTARWDPEKRLILPR